MAVDGVGEMVLFEGQMSSEKYIIALETALTPATQSDGIKFQQDNATCHKSTHSMVWMAQNRIELID